MLKFAEEGSVFPVFLLPFFTSALTHRMMHYDCFKGILSLQRFVNDTDFSSSKKVSAKFYSNVCIWIYLNTKCMIFLLQNSPLALPYCSDRKSVILRCPKTFCHCDVCLKDRVLSLYHVQTFFLDIYIYLFYLLFICLFIYFFYTLYACAAKLSHWKIHHISG